MNPTAAWVSQQLREAFPFDEVPTYLIHDNDTIFGDAVRKTITSLGIKSKPTSYRSPWQNGICERWGGTLRRELLDHIVPLGEHHLRRQVLEFKRYYHEDRTHLGLGKETPTNREVTPRPSASATVVSLPRVGGVHHRYEWKEAA